MEAEDIKSSFKRFKKKGSVKSSNGAFSCILSIVKQITSTGWMHETSARGLVHWEDPEESGGEGGGRGNQDEEHM